MSIKRTPLRLWVGCNFYILKRQFEWKLSRIAKTIAPDKLPIELFT
ncbi:MAG: hypothetical protein LH631_08630 [Alkalinema sp. CAN_BIN05]|nr:hypothetical protein [Alkalinema sp. CAN_BIN05]